MLRTGPSLYLPPFAPLPLYLLFDALSLPLLFDFPAVQSVFPILLCCSALLYLFARANIGMGLSMAAGLPVG